MNKKSVSIVGFSFIILAIIIAFILISTSHRYDTPNDVSDVRNISISVSDSPYINFNGTLVTISYHLFTSPFEKNELKLVKVDIIEKKSGNVVRSFKGENLTTEAMGLNNTKSSINISFTCNATEIPIEITHRLSFISSGRAILPFDITGGELIIQ